jgi:hypothetical protein
MKTHEVIDRSSFGPEALKVVGTAFDKAWEDVEFKFTTPQAKEEARTHLANAILSIATDDSHDAQELRNFGIKSLLLKYSWLADD